MVNDEATTAKLAALAGRVSAAKAEARGAGRDLLPGPVSRASRRFPAEGALGRLGRARLQGLARAGRAPLPSRPHDLLQLRIGLRAPRLCRSRDAAGPQVRGQPRASGLAGPQLRQGSRDHQPDHRPGPHPVPDAPGRRRGARAAGSRSVVGRGPRHARGPHPPGDRRGPPQRDHGPHRPAGRGRVHRACAGELGRRRSQLAHERLLERGTGRLPVLDGHGPARAPTTPTQTSST